MNVLYEDFWIPFLRRMLMFWFCRQWTWLGGQLSCPWWAASPGSVVSFSLAGALESALHVGGSQVSLRWEQRWHTDCEPLLWAPCFLDSSFLSWWPWWMWDPFPGSSVQKYSRFSLSLLVFSVCPEPQWNCDLHSGKSSRQGNSPYVSCFLQVLSPF